MLVFINYYGNIFHISVHIFLEAEMYFIQFISIGPITFFLV